MGLGLDSGELAIPVKPRKPRPRVDEGFELWLKESKEVVLEYKKLLDYWRKTYSPRSPIDKVDDRYIESLQERGYANYYLEQLLFGSENDKRACYDLDRDYPLTVKERLDKLDTVSRKVCKSNAI